MQSAFFNIIPYVHSRDYTGRERTGWYGNAEIRSDDSITNYDQEREAPRFELHACRANTPQGSATITDVMARKLARYQDPRRIGSLQMPFEGLEYEPGSTAAITHIEGIGADGWAGAKCASSGTKSNRRPGSCASTSTISPRCSRIMRCCGGGAERGIVAGLGLREEWSCTAIWI